MKHSIPEHLRRTPRTHENRVLQAYGPELALCVRTCADRDVAHSRMVDAAHQFLESPESDGCWRQLAWARDAYQQARQAADRALALEQAARLA